MKYLVLGALCTAQALPALAQENTLPPVEVIAEGESTPTLESLEDARGRIRNLPGGVNIVDAEQYREGRVSTLPDALQFSPGVFAASRFGAEEARISIRGSGLQRTFHMRGLQLLQDGVPLNLADGSADFQAVEPLAARYVEIYRGANALQYGATTLGGAVNFVSPSGRDSPLLSGRVEAGSFGYKRAQIAAGGNEGNVDWFIAGAQFFQKGFRNHSRQDTQRVSGNLGWRVSPDIDTRFFISIVNSDSELPGALTLAEMRANPRQADPAAVSGDQKRDFKLYRLSNKTTFLMGEARRVEVGGFYSVKSLFHPIFQVLQQDSDDYGVHLRYIATGEVLGRRNEFVIGANLVRGRLDDDRFRNVAGRPAARTGEAIQESANYTVFVQNQHDLFSGTALILGAQAVRASRELRDRFLSNGDNGVDQTYRHVSPKIGLRHDLSKKAQAYANVSGSYEPPTFGELAGGADITPVAAQRAKTIEVGTRGDMNADRMRMKWDVSLYRAQLKKELLALNDTAGNPLGTTNARRTVHQGIEAGLEFDFYRHWTWRASYQFNDFRFDHDAVYGNNRLAGIPKHFANTELLYRTGNGIYFGPTLRVASATIVDHANTLKAPGYGILGFKLGRQVNRSVSWFVDARNLTDKTYAATTGVIADARGVDSRQFYPGDERAFFAGIEMRY